MFELYYESIELVFFYCRIWEKNIDLSDNTQFIIQYKQLLKITTSFEVLLLNPI